MVTALRSRLRCARPVTGLSSWSPQAVSLRIAAMCLDNELQKHCAQHLGIGGPWAVQTVELKLAVKEVAIEPAWQWGADAQCP